LHDFGEIIHWKIKQNILMFDKRPEAVIETFVYQEKEEFIEFISKLLDVQKLKQDETLKVNTSKL
jgi:hypothetical protein